MMNLDNHLVRDDIQEGFCIPTVLTRWKPTHHRGDARAFFIKANKMTLRELALVAGVSVETVRTKGKELYPDKFAKGKRTSFNRLEATNVMAELRKKGFVQHTENREVHTENLDVVTRQDLALFGASIVSEMMKQFLPLIQNRQPLMIEQDYYSITGYANKIGQKVAFSEALVIGKTAGRLSRENGKEIRKVDDERWGQVNSYHIDVLKEVFQL